MAHARFAIDILVRVVLFAFIGVAWNLMGGYAKQLSLGHAAYFGLGAYTSTILLIKFGVSPWIGMIAGGVVATLASLADRLAVLSLARTVFRDCDDCDGASLHAAVPEVPRLRVGRRRHDDSVLGQCAADDAVQCKSGVLLHRAGAAGDRSCVTYSIERSWIGYYLVAVGEDEDAAEAVGVNAPRIKRDVYMISAFLTALAGTFYVQYIYFIDPNTAFSFNVSVEAALVSIVGGIGTLWGPVLGTALLEPTSALLQSWLGASHGGVQLTVYALILMAVILWRPASDCWRMITSASSAPERSARKGLRVPRGRDGLRHSSFAISARNSAACAQSPI